VTHAPRARALARACARNASPSARYAPFTYADPGFLHLKRSLGLAVTNQSRHDHGAITKKCIDEHFLLPSFEVIVYL
jgi:hypothetical protein